MTRPTPRRPPNTRQQLDTIRDDLHRTITETIGAWEHVWRLSRQIGGGYSQTNWGTATTNKSKTTVVETAVMQRVDGIAGLANDWLSHLREFIGHAQLLHDELEQIKEAERADDDEIEEKRGRTNTVEKCKECGEPVNRIKRLDGDPYHHPNERAGCWWAAYNRTRGRRPAASDTADPVQPDETAGH